MKIVNNRNDNSTAQNESDPREAVMMELGLTAREKERFRRARDWEINSKPSSSLDAQRRLLASRMLQTAPNRAISLLKALMHQDQPARLHAVGLKPGDPALPATPRAVRGATLLQARTGWGGL